MLATKTATLQPDRFIKATEKQLALLRKLGHTGTTDKLDVSRASAIIDGLIAATKDARAHIKDSVDLRELAAPYTQLRRESAQSLCGPCPKCGGDNRFYVKADFFACRKCYPQDNGLPHDAVAFITWKDNVEEAEAIATLNGGPLAAPTAPPVQRTPPPKPAPIEAWRTAEWQRENVHLAKQAHERLFNDSDHEAEEGRRYLDGRGLDPFTWQTFKLGFAMHEHSQLRRYEPAIVMPWYTIKGILRGVRFRYLRQYQIGIKDDKPLMSDKQTSVTGAGQFAGAFFGGQAIGGNIPSLSTIIICEGEFNACSIWQTVKNQHVNVFSMGSQSATITPAMVEYTAQYARVMVWLDEEERAQKVMGALPGAHGIKSPGGNDANDLLKSEALGGFLALHRFQAARDRTEQESMLWDTWDASNVWPGADNSTLEVLAHIAKTLGISL
jgi:hypothetical protein